MKLPAETRARLDSELSKLRHLTRAERAIWHTVRTSGSVRRSDVRDLIAELERLPSAIPTPTERELIAIVRANR